MGQHDRALKILVIDPDERFQAELRSYNAAGTQFPFSVFVTGGAPHNQIVQADVVVVGVDWPKGLALVENLCKRSAMPPVIAIGGASFDAKPPEHILLLAEVRGAVLSLPKPLLGSELMVAAFGVAHRPRAEPPQTSVHGNDTRPLPRAAGN
jgi:hypothetical protein